MEYNKVDPKDAMLVSSMVVLWARKMVAEME